jgi:hypothetical protein
MERKEKGFRDLIAQFTLSPFLELLKYSHRGWSFMDSYKNVNFSFDTKQSKKEE